MSVCGCGWGGGVSVCVCVCVCVCASWILLDTCTRNTPNGNITQYTMYVMVKMQMFLAIPVLSSVTKIEIIMNNCLL